MTPSSQKYSCVTCARRKVKCDKQSPCSNCSRSQKECNYQAPALSQRHRKRPADEDLLSKISEYENLLRKNNVEFQPLDNSWIPSPMQEKLVSTHQTARSPLQGLNEPEWAAEAPGPGNQSQLDFSVTQSETARLWSSLPKELRDPTIEKFRRPGEDEAEVEDLGSGSRIGTALLIPVCISDTPQLLELHPEPRHIFKLWQVFAEDVNPLIMVIHAPSLQQRLLEMSWNLEKVTRPLQCIMFGVYALAITSLKPSDCVQTFGETRSILLNRYRAGVAQALVAAELHSTRDLEVLQALVLFLLLDNRSELSVTVIAIAARIGHKMGLHRTGTDPHIPFFEQEMGLRVWWQVMRLESWARRKALCLGPPIGDYGDVRMPMNVNDVELHPHMAARPIVEHSGATEMIFCLMKYEIVNYVRSWVTKHVTITNVYDLVSSNSPDVIARKRKVLADVAEIFERKYLRYCDPRIPLHNISAIVAQVSIQRVRFWSYHPRYQPDGGNHLSQEDQDILFESSVRLIELHYDMRMTNFSAHLLEHMLARTEVQAFVHMVSELQLRVSGDLVWTAWTLVQRMFEEFPQLLRGQDKFYTALADLTLKAWEARFKEMGSNGDAVPEFIWVLQGMKGGAGTNDASTAAIRDMITDGGFSFEMWQDDPLDWVYWNEFAQL